MEELDVFDDVFACDVDAAAVDVVEPTDVSRLDVAVDAIVEALQIGNFVAAEPVHGGEGGVSIASGVHICLAFGGPAAGSLELLADGVLGRELAAGTLGVDAEDPLAAEASEDALRELANVAAGAMMPRLVSLAGGDEAAECPLGLPELRKPAASEPDGWDDAVTLRIEQRLLKVRLRDAA